MFAHVFSLAIPAKKCLENCILSESVDLKKTKQKQNKKISTHMFLGNAMYNAYAKFQGKIANRTLVGAPGSFQFLN